MYLRGKRCDNADHDGVMSVIEEVMVGRKWWRDGGGDREAVVMKMGMVLVIGKSA